jgi:hypothetical protein
MWWRLFIGTMFVAILAIAVNVPAIEPKKEKTPSERAYMSDQVASVLTLLQLELVRKEIVLTDAQRAKLAPLEKEVGESFEKIIRDNPKVQGEKSAPAVGKDDSNKGVGRKEPNINAPKENEAERQKKLHREFGEHEQKFHEKLGKILRHDQLIRLGEIILQSESFIQPGNELVGDLPEEFNSELIKLWNISEAQEKEIHNICWEARLAMEDIRKGLNALDEELPRLSESQAKIELHKQFRPLRSIIDQANNKLLAILTPKQHDAIARDKGKEIDFVTLVEQNAELDLIDKTKKTSETEKEEK